MEIRKGVDNGEIYVVKEIDYAFPITGKKLNLKLQMELIKLFKKHWSKIYSGEIVAYEQKSPPFYHTRKQTETDMVLDSKVNSTFEDFIRWILAHGFNPGSTAEVKFGNKSYKVLLKIESVDKAKR